LPCLFVQVSSCWSHTGKAARQVRKSASPAGGTSSRFGVAEIIAFLSTLMTLRPGDIIATGTPAGIGFKREPPVYLQPGDVVEVEIEGIGTIRNPVVSEA
jgi:fumarylacetoacetase-like protein